MDGACMAEVATDGVAARDTATYGIQALFIFGWLSETQETFGPVFFGGVIFALMDVGFQMVQPLILRILMDFVGDPEAPAWHGFFIATLFLVASLCSAFVVNIYFNIAFVTGMNVRTAVMAVVYRKALRISNSARCEATVGEIVNLLSVDSQRFLDLIQVAYMAITSPLTLVLGTLLAWQQLGPSVLSAVVVMALLIPLNIITVGVQRRYFQQQMVWKDRRIKCMSEMLNGIKVLKLYAWEVPFSSRVSWLRNVELRLLRSAAYLQSLTAFVFRLAPQVLALASFGTYILMSKGNVLTADKIFVSLAVFNFLRVPLGIFPQLIQFFVQSRISLQRLSRFLLSDELQLDAVLREPASAADEDGMSIIVKNATFAWNTEPILSDIDLQIKRGSLVAVVGQVGAGKSSLCSALIGLMMRQRGEVRVRGRVAFVSQQAWIQNLTVRDNILYGAEYERRHYRGVVRACALEPDLLMLAAGDRTEIGEKGINLSGGQKQRVALARATYSRADVILLDDPLSAVDSHVAKHLFSELLDSEHGMLRSATRILVTHSVGYLDQVDRILVMEGGRIVQSGTYQELLHSDGPMSKLLAQYAAEEEVEQESPPTVPAQLSDDDEDRSTPEREQLLRQRRKSSGKGVVEPIRSEIEKIPRNYSASAETALSEVGVGVGEVLGAQLIEVEESATGNVDFAVYWAYCRDNSYTAVLAISVFYIFTQVFNVSTNLWLTDWSNDALVFGSVEAANSPAQRSYRLIGYAVLIGVQGLFILMSAFLIAYGTMRATRVLHNSMLNRIMRAPMSFFDTTPIGRMVNRFSKDVDTVDINVPQNLRQGLALFFTILGSMFIISYTQPIFIIFIFPLAAFYMMIQRFYASTARQLRRLEAVSRSPIYNHFGESVTGSPIIIATGQQARFIAENERRIDGTNSAYYPYVVSMRWLSILLGALGAFVVFMPSLLAVLTRGNGNSSLAGLAGLAITNALNVTGPLIWLVRVLSELESNIVSAERIREYSLVAQEAAWQSTTPLADAWPSDGRVSFERYSTRYRPTLELVLRQLDCSVRSGEKIGIVGRTGAGKSSLTQALFRLIEAAEGRIRIDDIDIADVGLQQLRSRLTIIPQDPVIFSGSLRFNIDPSNLYTDERIWAALEHAHLMTVVKALPQQLDFELAEEGQNLSVGQRQLVCLARALLRKTKILVLDEATAAIDFETDELIQESIRSEFADCTVLTIAHRLNTILDSDRVMVLDGGRIAEFDQPSRLLEDKTTSFYKLALDAGVVSDETPSTTS